MSFCSNCGKELMEGAAFCAECGTPVKQPATPAVQNNIAPSSVAAPAAVNPPVVPAGKGAPFYLIGGAAFVICALIRLYWIIRYESIGIWDVTSLAIIAGCAAALFSKNKYPVFQIAISAGVIWQFCWFMRMADAGCYEVFTSYDYSETKFSLFCMLPDLLRLLAYIAACLVALALGMKQLEKYKHIAEKFWFIPTAVYGLSVVTNLLKYILYDLFNFWFGFSEIVFDFVFLIGVTAFILFMEPVKINMGSRNTSYNAAGNAAVSGNTGANTTAQPVNAQAGYCDMVKHVLLLLFTFGIWQCIWIYKTTELLNCIQDEPPRNPTTKLLLCIFVPFYIVYWMYKHAQYIDKFAAAKGVHSDIAVLCLVLEFFVPIVPPIVMQDKINNIVKA